MLRGAASGSAVVCFGLLFGVATAVAQTDTSTTTGSGATAQTSTSPHEPRNGAGVANADATAGAVDATRRSAGTSSEGKPLKRVDKRFLTKAVESSSRELALSALAAQRASDPRVRDYARQIVAGHGQMNQQLVELAQQKGLPASAATTPALPAPGSATVAGSGPTSTSVPPADEKALTHPDRHVRKLAKKTGAEFDREYIALMLDEQEGDVKLFRKAAEDAVDPDVRAFANQHVVSLQTHLDHVTALTSSVAE